MKTIKQTKTFEVGQIAYCNGGCTMQLPTFYKVVKRTDKTVWLQEIANVIETSDNAENNIYDIVDFMIGIMSKDQLKQVEDMLTNLYPQD